MRDLLLILDRAGVIEFAGAALADALGVAPADLIGQPAGQFFELPDRPGAALRSAAAHPILTGIHRDGRSIRFSLTQHEIEGIHETHLILLLQDPTLPSLPANVSLQHKELYELATRQGRISVWEVDYRTNHLEFSPVLAQMLGLDEKDIPTTVEAWSKLFHPDDWQALEREAARLLARDR